jgi:hypothetical protein
MMRLSYRTLIQLEELPNVMLPAVCAQSAHPPLVYNLLPLALCCRSSLHHPLLAQTTDVLRSSHLYLTRTAKALRCAPHSPPAGGVPTCQLRQLPCGSWWSGRAGS